MNRKKWTIVAAAAVSVLLVWYFFRAKGGDEKITHRIKRSDFLITVTATGELQAKHSEDIMGPNKGRNVGVYQMKITDMVSEGTIVKQGDYVATLDRSEISGKLKDLESELEKSKSLFTKTQLDTTLELRTARDELINLKYAMEEKKLTLDQSKYEPPATIRQAEIDMDKAQRAYDQAVKNYSLKKEQSKAKMQEVSATLDMQQRKYDEFMDVMDQFVIKAPKGGMVIYKKDWDGKKIVVGSTVNAWDPAVATLPDLSLMISKTYINEIDISKVKVSQEVEIGVDAFPDRKYKGKILEVANIGEQLKNSDAKVFEVTIMVVKSDTTLRPSMTTSNRIIIARVPNVIYIPLDAVTSENGKAYVYKKGGFKTVKQEVKLGRSGENEVEIEKGLNEGDEIFLSPPDDPEHISLSGL